MRQIHLQEVRLHTLGHKRPYISPPPRHPRVLGTCAHASARPAPTLAFRAQAPAHAPAPQPAPRPRVSGTSAHTSARPTPTSHFGHMRPYISPSCATLTFRAQAPAPKPAPRLPRISGTCAHAAARPVPPSRFGHMRPHLSPPRATLAFRAHAPMHQHTSQGPHASVADKECAFAAEHFEGDKTKSKEANKMYQLNLSALTKYLACVPTTSQQLLAAAYVPVCHPTAPLPSNIGHMRP